MVKCESNNDREKELRRACDKSDSLLLAIRKTKNGCLFFFLVFAVAGEKHLMRFLTPIRGSVFRNRFGFLFHRLIILFLPLVSLVFHFIGKSLIINFELTISLFLRSLFYH